MKTSLLKVTFLLFCLFIITSTSGQNILWQKVEETGISNKSTIQDYKAGHFSVFSLDFHEFKRLLKNAPLRGSNQTQLSIPFPDAQGKLENFKIFEAPVFSPSLSAKYPEIKSFVGFGEKGSVIRFSQDPRGTQAMIKPLNESTTYIHFFDNDPKTYVAYTSRATSENLDVLYCGTIDDFSTRMAQSNSNNQRDANDQVLRKYRMAVSATGEYTSYFGGTVAQSLAAINATLTRVNMIFETDVAATFEVQDFDQLIYTDALTDPYSEASIGTDNFGSIIGWNAQIQNTLSSEIGNVAYDIGHLFAVNDAINGNAGCIGCVCDDDDINNDVDYNKGAGYTSYDNPQGEYFDLVTSHEIGHQMGANHTWSFNVESGTGTNSEPGSGSTVMGYAGITGVNDVQTTSDPYFHYHSIRQITDNFVVKNCWENNAPVTISNNPPSANAGDNYTIPKGTAYVLRGIGTDPDVSDNILFCWEGIDNGQVTSGTFGPTTISGSLVRSLPPSMSSDRYIPKLSRVIAGQLTETNPAIGSDWETVSTTNRNLNYALTVRDRAPDALGLGGQTAFDTMTITVDASTTVGPFVVTSQQVNETWFAGNTHSVSWDVAGTDGGLVNTSSVNILLSIDGGLTFPFTLASDIPNNGNADIVVPDIGVDDTTSARIIVEAKDNIYYAMNASDFEIQKTDFALTANENNVSICSGDDASYSFVYNTFLGFNGETTFSIPDLPPGTSVNFSPTSTTMDGATVVAAISGTENLSNGTYNLSIEGNSGSSSFTENVSLVVYDTNLVTPALNQPLNNASLLATDINFQWGTDSNSESYLIEIATDSNFNTIVDSSVENQESYITSLLSDMQYYWRVMPSNACGDGSTSSINSFSTLNCMSYDATDLPLAISSIGGGIAYNSIITINDDLMIEDIDVIINIDHTWDADLDITLTAPDNTVIELSTDNGSGNDNYTNTIFDNEATNPIINGTPPFTGRYSPEGDLSSIYGLSSLGDWTLTVIDDSDQDGGTILDFSLDICAASTALSNQEFSTDENQVSVYPNPNNGSFTIRSLGNLFFDKTNIILYDLTGKIVYREIVNGLVKYDLKLEDLAVGVYMLNINDNTNRVIKRVIIN